MRFLVRHKILWISVIVAAISTYLIAYSNNFTLNFILGAQTSPYEIAKLVSSLSGILLGFLLTAVAMLTAIMDRKLVENMRKTGHYQVFITDCFTNCLTLLITTILGVATLFISLPILNFVFLSMLFFSICSITYLVILGRRFLLIFCYI